MILSELKINHLRNIVSAHLVLNSRFNFIIGSNGSGKTSILEALYLLSCGHSFRSREITPIINHDHSSLTVFASSADDNMVSIQKSSSNPTQIKLNNQFCTSTSQLAYATPCQIIYSDIFQIIDAGPSVRRSLLDWGLFHVKHTYLSVLKEYKKILKQRNALLKTNASYDHFVPWDQQLNAIAEQLDLLRKEYFQQWESVFYRVLEQLTDTKCTIHYFKGWDRKCNGKDLFHTLADNFENDKQKHYTQYGAHQADIFIESDDFKAKQVLSRGQQKIILIALKLSQGELVTQNCLYLFDDLVAELDDNHKNKLFSYLIKVRGQFVITSINNVELPSELSPTQSSRFQIKHGSVEIL